MTKHTHHEAIIAWANGETIEWSFDGKEWNPSNNNEPRFNEMLKYRVKPAEPERADYPKTRMTRSELSHAWDRAPDESFTGAVEFVANAALRHACDTGQIVTREEFDRAVGDRFAHDLAVAHAVNEAVKREGFAPSDSHINKIIKGVTQ